jgi:hypothetical protein
MANSQTPLPLLGHGYRPVREKQVLYLPYAPSYFDDEDAGPEIRNQVAKRLLLDMLRGRPSSNIQEICLLAPARLVKKSPEHVLGNARAWLKGTGYEKRLGRAVCNDCFWKKKAPGLSVAGTRDYRNVQLCEFRVDGLQHVALMAAGKESGSKRPTSQKSGNPLKKKGASGDDDSDEDSSDDESSADDSKIRDQALAPSKRVRAGKGPSAADGPVTAAGTINQESLKMLSNIPPGVMEGLLRSEILGTSDNTRLNQVDKEHDKSKNLNLRAGKN